MLTVQTKNRFFFIVLKLRVAFLLCRKFNTKNILFPNFSKNIWQNT